MGGTKILDGNIQPLFDHQTVLEDSNGGNIQTKYNDYQNNLPLNGKNSISGIDDIVPITEYKLLEDYADTKQGSIDFRVDLVPSPMDLCYDEDTVMGYIYADVIGNYEPFICDNLGTQLVTIAQTKGSDWNHVKGGNARIEWAWTPDDGCDYDEYIGTIITNEEISLASNQWPIVTGDLDLVYPSGGYGTYPEIPCKMVDIIIESDWTGCRNFDEQGFTVLSVQDNYQFPK